MKKEKKKEKKKGEIFKCPFRRQTLVLHFPWRQNSIIELTTHQIIDLTYHFQKPFYFYVFSRDVCFALGKKTP